MSALICDSAYILLESPVLPFQLLHAPYQRGIHVAVLGAMRMDDLAFGIALLAGKKRASVPDQGSTHDIGRMADLCRNGWPI